MTTIPTIGYVPRKGEGTATTNSGESVVDHETLAAAAADIRAGADELDISKEIADIMTAFREETSEGQGTGVPLIWRSTEIWLEECLDILRSRLEDVKAAMYDDARQLEEFSAKVKAHEAEVAGQVTAVFTDPTQRFIGTDAQGGVSAVGVVPPKS